MTESRLVRLSSLLPPSENRHRRRRRLTRRAAIATLAAGSVAALASLRLGHHPVSAPAAVPAAPPAPPTPPAPAVVVPPPPSLPGLGATILSGIPAASSQVVLVTGPDADSSSCTLTVFNRTPDGGWHPLATWPARNGRLGWTSRHLRGDLRSPVGVYTLTDAGGRRRDPGSRLPYYRDEDFTADGTGFNGEPLAGAFDYVIAIDYNRVPGSSPLDDRRPLGPSRGGGIWLHVDHGGPTQGCITLPEARMVDLLHLLDPAAQPVIVMGDAPTLAI